MYKKNKGFTLVECATYMLLSVLVMTIGFKLLVISTNTFLKTVNKSLELNSIKVGYLDIERFLRDAAVKKIRSEENKIILYRGDEKNIYEIQEISQLENKLIVKYFDIRNFNKYTTRNTIISSISSFKVENKGKLLYITINKGGNEYKKCI